MTHKELISIIIVNWNGQKWLDSCLASLHEQTYKHYEVIFVDNASTDDSVVYVKKKYPWVKVVQSATNLGFAGGNNLGFKHSKGEFILLLNNDTRVEETYLEEFIQAFDEIPHLGAAQSKIVLMDHPQKLDACGAYWTDSTFLYHFGYYKNESLPAYNKAQPLFSDKGASMMIKRSVIEKVGLFDDDFWCYYEETDFCHRVWLAGFECWYYPKAKVYHAMGGTSLLFGNEYLQFHNFKNKFMSFLKNFSWTSLITILPKYLVINGALSLVWLLTGKMSNFLAYYHALWWNMLHLADTLRKRRTVQKLRTVSDSAIFRVTKRNPTLRYYYYLFRGNIEALGEYEDAHSI